MARIQDVINTLTPEELDLLNNDPNMLAAFKAKYAETTLRQKLGAALPVATELFTGPQQAAATFINTPARGIMGLGVGAEKLLSGSTPNEALQRASAATQPGYQPQPGEQLGALPGEIVKPTNLLAAELGGEALSFLKGPSKALAQKGINATETAAGIRFRPVDIPTPAKAARFLEDVASQDLRKVTPQFLKDSAEKIGGYLDKTKPGSINYAFASDLKNKLLKALNERVAGRIGHAANYATALRREKLFSPVKAAIKGTVYGGSAYAGYHGLKKLFGGH